MFHFKNKRIGLAFLKHKLRNLRIVLPAVLLCSMLGIMSMPINSVKEAKGEGTNTPRFNFLPGDYEMLQVANNTAGSTWTDPISANIGDRIAFSLYFHNGVLNSTAHNTSVKVALPQDQGTSLVSQSFLWSDETPVITDTVVDGNIVGLSGATVNVPSNARLEYVSGSTNMYVGGSQTPTHFPDGIVSPTGLNIGDVNGCWEFAGFVTFLVDIKGPAQLDLEKLVARPGDPTWHEEITVNPGDSVAYRASIVNTGGTTATGVSISDILPIHMTYEPGTTYLYTKENPNGIRQADTLFTTGLVIPDIAPGADNVVYLTYRVKVDAVMPSGTFSLNNVAKVFMNGVEQDQDQARVFVTATRGIVVDKKVSNGVSWVEENSAKLGDTLDYRIIIRNTGNNPITGIFVRDALPQFVTYKAGSTKVNGVAVGDEIITSAGLSLGTLNPGCEITITLSGIVTGCAPLGESNLINTAYGRGDSVTEISDSAITILTVNLPVRPN